MPPDERSQRGPSRLERIASFAYFSRIDQTCVSLELVADHGLEFRLRHGERVGADLEELRAHVWIVHSCRDLLVQAIDDGLRRARRHERTDPEVVVRVGITQLYRRWHIGEQRASFRRAHSEGNEL